MLKVNQKSKKEKTVLINIKVTLEDRKALAAKAEKFANGNLSLWLRYAGKTCQPLKKDLLKSPGKPRR